jgi:hypothetical protein
MEQKGPKVVVDQETCTRSDLGINLFFPRLTGEDQDGGTPSFILPRRGGEEERQNGFENNDT